MVSDLLEAHASKADQLEGFDLVDYFIQRNENFGWAMFGLPFVLGLELNCFFLLNMNTLLIYLALHLIISSSLP